MQTNSLEDNRKISKEDLRRYVQLAILVIVAGNIYPLIYLRQNFEVTILETFNITATQLGQNYFMLGMLYMITYLPSGWLADRISPHILMSFSLAAAGLLGVWFYTIPSFESMQIIFAGWGIAAGLTFWSALIKATNLLAKKTEQGRFFGILDGGRGLVEALLASIAIWMFTVSTESSGNDGATALQQVILMYVGCMLVLSPIAFFALPDGKNETSASSSANTNNKKRAGSLRADLLTIASKLDLWLCAICILTGYSLFWATYSFSAYMQTHYGLTAVAVGYITVAKLWMRPIGAVAAGFAGDFLNLEKVLGVLMLLASMALFSLVLLPTGSSTFALLSVVLLVGLLTYAVRGIFWSTLESCNVSNSIKGLAIGVISLIGYSPDIFLPLMNGYFVDNYEGKTGYNIYYSLIATMGLVGTAAAFWLKHRVTKNKVA